MISRAPAGRNLTLQQIAAQRSRRMEPIRLRGSDGRRPVFGAVELFQADPHWRNHVPFHEDFHGDSGRGVGAVEVVGAWRALEHADEPF